MRIGAYGICIKDDKILLSQKKSGPYKGLWGLPGGRIEPGEDPQEALIREFAEEVGIKIAQAQFLHTVEVEKDGFEQRGDIFRVQEWNEINDAEPEELFCFFPLNELDLESLTPLALSQLDI